MVEIEKSRAAAGGFKEIRVAFLAAERGFRAKTRFARDVDELDGQRRSKSSDNLIEAENSGGAGNRADEIAPGIQANSLRATLKPA